LWDASVLIFSCLLAFASAHAAAPAAAWDFTGPANVPDGLPDILWRRQSLNEMDVWAMNYTQQYPDILSYVGGNSLPSLGESGWQVVGVADFGTTSTSSALDGYNDILFQQSSGLVGLWFMQGPSVPAIDTTVLNSAPPPGSGWRIVGAGDFGSYANGAPSTTLDGEADIVWQDPVTGQKAIWFMNGITVLGTTTIESSSTNWRIVGIADFGTPSSTTPDTHSDFLLANDTVGNLAVRYMSAYNPLGSDTTIMNGTSAFTYAFDIDLQVYEVADFIGKTQSGVPDAKPDILVRHRTDCRLLYWQLDGANLVREWDNTTVLPKTWDPDWRAGTQGITDSTWRLTRKSDPVVIATSGSDGITLWVYDFPGGQTFTVERADANTGVFSSKGTGLTLPWMDTSVAGSSEYDYRVTASYGLSATTRAVQYPSIIHSRGKVLVVVENSLYTQPTFGNYWNTFLQDLVQDGWEVVTKTDARRHTDDWSASDKDGVAEIKTFIASNLTGAKAVILLGHVPIPYSGDPNSGLSASDGHTPDHQTCWTADMYYGDTDGVWTDLGNGQFSNNFPPSPIELAVGRIDFARLPAFGVVDRSTNAAGAETTLIQNYLTKDHNYRIKAAPFPLPDKVIDMNSWYVNDPNPNLPRYERVDLHAKQITSEIYNGWSGNITVADPFRNNSRDRDSTGPVPYLFAIAGGGGGDDQIYNQRGDLKAMVDPVLKNLTAGPAAAFWFPHGSYFADFNRNPNNLVRSILATPNYSLAVMSSSSTLMDPSWSMAELAWGKTLGECWLTTINYARYGASSYRSTPRWVSIQGDPTLHLNSVGAPSLTSASVSGSNVLLTWSGGETSSFYIYRSSSSNGSFSVVPGITQPISGAQSNFAIADDPANRWYMVRCSKNVNLGRVQYTSLSPGSIRQAP